MTNSKDKPAVVLTQRYADAVAYASVLHADQARKATTIPYISHLLGVSSLVLEAGGDEDMAIAALLHDGPEDQGGQPVLDEIRERFGDRVAHIVEGCTDSLSEDPEAKAPGGSARSPTSTTSGTPTTTPSPSLSPTNSTTHGPS